MKNKLKHLLFISGNPVKNFEGEKKYYSTGNINTENYETVTYSNRPSRANTLVKENDILIAKMKNTNKTTLVTKSMENNIYSTGFTVLNTNKLYKKYLYYLLCSPEFIEKKDVFSVGTTQLSINDETLLNLEINYINDIKKQEKVAIFLDKKVEEIDKVIEKTNETIEDYKKYKQSIITKAVTKGIDENAELTDSKIEWIKKIPKTWKVLRLDKILQFIGGYAYKSEEFCNETEYQVIRLGNVKNDCFILDDKQVFINKNYAAETQKCLVKEDDILFTMTGTKGKKDYFYTLKVEKEDLKKRKLYLNQRVGCFRKKDKNIYMRYYNYLFKYEPLRDYIFLFETGTANQGNIGIESINIIKLLLPSYDEQVKIASYIEEKCNLIDTLIKNKEKLIAQLENYKKSLIYEYVTGKKEVNVDTNLDSISNSPVKINCKDSKFAQAILLCKIIDKLMQYNLGRVKAEKTLFLIEQDIGFNFKNAYVREKAGPLSDNIYKCEGILQRNKWVNVKQIQKYIEYEILPDFNKYTKYYDKYYSDYNDEIEKIINIIKDCDMDKAEIIATLYASWNDFIIKGEKVSDIEIVKDVRENWNDSKKRFNEETWLNALNEMKKIGLVPKGHGNLTVIKEQ